MRGAFALLLALSLAQPGDLPLPTLRHVPVPIVVHDSKDRAVPALTAADFQIRDGGELLSILDVSYVPPPAADPVSTEPPADANAPIDDDEASAPGTRIFAFYLDEFHVRPAAAARVRDLVGGFIREYTTERDVLVVVKPLDPLLSLSLHRGRGAALDAVASFEGRAGDYEPRTTLERELLASDPVRLDRSRARISLSAIQAVATRLGRLGPARKAFVIASDGIPPPPPFGSRTGGGVTVDSIVRAANRGNVSVSTVVPRLWDDAETPPTGEIAAGLTFLSELVRLTDGRRVGATPAEGWPAVAADLGGYYVVTVDGADDGAFHTLSVSVTRPGVRVRTRPGYWAVAGAEIARAAKAMAPKPARPVLPALRTSRMILPWIGQERSRPGQTRLTFVWEPRPSRAGERAGVLPPSRLVLTARTTDGATLYKGVVQGNTAGIGASSVATFDAPPGRVRLEMSIEDASARVLDTDVRDVVVGALDGVLTFGTPRVFRARTAREFRALSDDPNAAPDASRTFTRVERLLIRTPLYSDPGGGPAEVTATLLNRMGHAMRPLPVTRDDGAIVSTELPLAGLAAGEYSVRWRARQGNGDVAETVPFRIVP